MNAQRITRRGSARTTAAAAALIGVTASLTSAAGRVCGMLGFQSAVEEIFDVQLLGGFRFPEVMGFQKDTLHHTFIVPDPTVSLQDDWASRRGYRDGSSARLASKLAFRGGRRIVSTI
jgi:hypothetical protein